MGETTDEPRGAGATEPDRTGVGAEAKLLLQRLIGCDTSNPPGREVQAVALLEAYLEDAGVECERVAKDPERPNLVARLRGRGSGPSLAFLGHLDVVPARRQDWSVEPFAAVTRDDAVWGRGTVDMKCQVAATTVALASLARERLEPLGDLMLLLVADEEVGDAGVGAPFLVEERPDLRPDYVIGEGAGERYDTDVGPLYLLDHGVKATCSVTLTVRGRAADASLRGNGRSAAFELARLLCRLEAFDPEPRIRPEVEPLLDLLTPRDLDPRARVAAVAAMNPALGKIVDALVRNVIPPTVVEAKGPANAVIENVTVTLQCAVLPGTTADELETEIRTALGSGDYELELSEPEGGTTSPVRSPLRDAIEAFLADRDPDARLVPALGYGFSDCHVMREAFGSIAYGFVPFRYADPLSNLVGKHRVDEHVLIDDLLFQTEAAIAIARQIAALEDRPATATTVTG